MDAGGREQRLWPRRVRLGGPARPSRRAGLPPHPSLSWAEHREPPPPCPALASGRRQRTGSGVVARRSPRAGRPGHSRGIAGSAGGSRAIGLSESRRRLPEAAVYYGSLRVRTTLGRPGLADAEPSESAATGDGADGGSELARALKKAPAEGWTERRGAPRKIRKRILSPGPRSGAVPGNSDAWWGLPGRLPAAGHEPNTLVP